MHVLVRKSILLLEVALERVPQLVQPQRIARAPSQAQGQMTVRAEDLRHAPEPPAAGRISRWM